MLKTQRAQVTAVLGVLAAVSAGALLLAPAEAQRAASSFGPANAKETYYWISQNSTLPLFVNNDYRGMKLIADELGIRVRVAGPTTIDLPGFIATVNQICAQRPAGISVVGGWDPSLTEAVTKCYESGVPIALDDGDLPNAKRLTHVGSDWYQIGVAQAQEMLKATGGKGKVATLSIINADNMKAAVRGFTDTVRGKLTIVANEDDKGDSQTAASVTASILAAHPDIAGIAGFDSESGAGIVRALQEANKAGKVKVTAMEQVPAFIKTVKDGSVNAIMIQKRELMTYYVFKLLHDFNQNRNKLTVNGLTGFKGTPIPRNVDTGLLVVTKSNVDDVMKALKVK